MEDNDSSQPCNCIDGNQPEAGLNNQRRWFEARYLRAEVGWGHKDFIKWGTKLSWGEKQVGWEPLSEKAGSHCTLKGRRSSSELSHSFIATTIAHHQKVKVLEEAKDGISPDTHHNIYWLVKGLNEVEWRWKRDNKKVLSTSHCGKPSSMDLLKSFLLLFLYISGLMFFSGCIKILPKTIAV